MTPTTRWLIALCFSASAPALAGTADDFVTLRYKFKTGERVRYELREEGSASWVGAGTNFRIQYSETRDISREVVSVDSGGKARIRLRVNRIDFKQDGPTAKDAAKIHRNLRDERTAGEFTVTIDPRGYISDFEMSPKLKEATKHLFSDDGKTPNAFSADNLKHTSGLIVLPEGPIRQGDSWRDEKEVKRRERQMLTPSTKFVPPLTLAGPVHYEGREVQKITWKPDMPEARRDDMPVGQSDVKVEEGHGTAYFDPIAGRLLATETTRVTKGKFCAFGNEISFGEEARTSMKLLGK
jgi:hypothetical protein